MATEMPNTEELRLLLLERRAARREERATEEERVQALHSELIAAQNERQAIAAERTKLLQSSKSTATDMTLTSIAIQLLRESAAVALVEVDESRCRM